VRGEVSPVSPEEESFLRKYAPPPGGFTWRLVCFCDALGQIEIFLPDEAMPVCAETQGNLPGYDGVQPGTYGLGVDIGTTTVTLAAYRFPGKEPVSVVSEMNRQSAFGADVISRIGGDHRALHTCVRAQLGDMLARTGAAPEEVSRAVITGNTAMLHFFAGLDPTGMGRYPFTPENLFGESLPWDLLPHASVYLPPCITAFVGADITCGALAAGFAQGDGNALLVDVGTNGEMLMRTNGQLRCCSVAAGPAFEGAEISMGMPALPGAIDRVWQADGRLLWHALPGAPIRGICGTGLVSALRAFLELGYLDETGAIAEPHTLCLPGCGVALSQQDVRKLQLVKAAVAAGIVTMLDEAGLDGNQIGRLWLAGGFGSYLDPGDAAAIGMIPAGLAARAKAGGNLALRGAEMLLFSENLRRDAKQLASDTIEVPLAEHRVFQEAFIDEMGFPE